MKIVQQGIVPDPVMHGDCINCNTVVECNRSETNSTFFFSRYFVDCPTCKRRLYVQEGFSGVVSEKPPVIVSGKNQLGLHVTFKKDVLLDAFNKSIRLLAGKRYFVSTEYNNLCNVISLVGEYNPVVLHKDYLFENAYVLDRMAGW